MTSKPEVIFIQDTVAKSWARDASTFVVFVALIGVGILLQSVALQWAGAIVAFLALFVRSSGIKTRMTLSIPEARKRLDELEARQ